MIEDSDEEDYALDGKGYVVTKVATTTKTPDSGVDAKDLGSVRSFVCFLLDYFLHSIYRLGRGSRRRACTEEAEGGLKVSVETHRKFFLEGRRQTASFCYQTREQNTQCEEACRIYSSG